MAGNEPKQVLIVRKDLNMRKGKIAAQAAHASMKAILSEGSFMQSFGHVEVVIPLNRPELAEWLEGRFTKVCVSVDSEQELLDIYQQAKEAGLICSLITDAGLTEFNGVPTNTVVAVGPAYPDDVNKITGHLKLL